MRCTNYMLKQRKQQIETGRIIPQTNEEYASAPAGYTCDARRAWSKSALISSMFSIPTETRM
jgi:hypothetical protein